MPLDHPGVEMTGSAGRDLLHRKAELRQSLGVVFGLQIAGEHGDARALVHALQRALQQRGLAEPGELIRFTQRTSFCR